MQQTTIFGPPGTGKTERLMQLVNEELRAGIQPRAIAFTTFTRVASDVAKERAARETGSDAAELKWFGTLHSLCGRLVGFPWGNKLLSTDDRDSQAYLRRFGREQGLQFVFGSGVDVEADAFSGQLPDGNHLLAWWDWARQSCLDIETATTRWRSLSRAALEPYRYARFAGAYEEMKRDIGRSDYTDVLLMADRAASSPPTDVLCVDEAQDFSPLQWRILDRWRQQAQRVYLAGDDDQAIYAFQGARAELFLDRAQEGEVETLSQSYRLKQQPWQLSQWLVSRIGRRADKPFAPRAGAGAVAGPRALERVEFGGARWFILARNAYLLQHARQVLEQRGIPYKARRGYSPVKLHFPAARAVTALARGGSVTRTDLVALVSQLRSGTDYKPDLRDRLKRRGSGDVPAEVRAADLPALGFTSLFCERMRQDGLPARLLWPTYGYSDARSEELWNYLVRLQRMWGDTVFEADPLVELSTIHGVKGDEADHVALLVDMAQASNRTLEMDPDSEHRVWYVGLTRARESVVLLPPFTPVTYPPLADGAWRWAMREAAIAATAATAATAAASVVVPAMSAATLPAIPATSSDMSPAALLATLPDMPADTPDTPAAMSPAALRARVRAALSSAPAGDGDRVPDEQ